jgi:subtilisin family serine protease
MEDAMKRSLSLLLPLALAACSGDATSPPAPTAPSAARAAGGTAAYIVVLNDDANPRAVAALLGIDPRRVYTAALTGFAAELNRGQLNALQHHPAVRYVEPDAPVQLFTTQLFPAWGLDRVDQHNLPLSSTFSYTANGTGVTVYVLDTGVRKTHAQFGGRADYIANGAGGDFVGDGHGNAEDCHGHGTHVAGIAGGSGYGVAKNVQIRAGRVVNCIGGGTTSMVISAMDWIVANGTYPSVVNMSLGYGDEQSVRDAAARLYQDRHVVVAAAGNGDFAGNPQNACQQSPAGYANALTVGSTTSADHESSFSNYGSCVDVLAPGSSIKSAWIGSDTATYVDSGTSMAAPHVAGVAALYLDLYPIAYPSTVNNAIKVNATSGVITLNNPFSGTPNKLLYTAW